MTRSNKFFLMAKTTDSMHKICILFRILLALLLVNLTNVGYAATPNTSDSPTITLVPAWVKPVEVEIPANAPADKVSQGVYYLLSDRQVRVEGPDRHYFWHVASKALNEKGVERVANIEIRFDPSYQTLMLHSVSLRRGDRIIPKLSLAAVKVLQREKELDYLIFDGSKTANIFLEDVRVGDVVEYAYSLKGNNPVFGGRSFGQFDMQWAVPVHKVFARLLWPAGRELFLKNLNDTQPSAVHELPGFLEHEWVGREVDGLRVSNDAPAWFDPYPSVQWGDFKDWAAVAQWAVPLYQVPTQLDADLRTEVDRIAREFPTANERLVAALQYVQRSIRYLGVEVGAGSHAPNPPSLVMTRRFGDCKDKTLLTLTMLNALGIDARAALVNTQTRRGVLDQRPSPGVFNHVMVRATVDGVDYWVDPTRSPQTGELKTISQPRFGAALIVDAASQGLQRIPEVAATLYTRKMLFVFDAQAGIDQPASFTVTSLMEGASAEEMRNTLASENAEELQKRYLNYYARYYPGIALKSAFSVSDNSASNQMTITERYTISDFWVKQVEKKRRQAQIEFPDMLSYFRAPTDVIRKEPLSVNHPMDIQHTTKVLLPDDWTVKPESATVKDPAFEFTNSMASTPRTVTFTNRFRTLADHVSAANMGRYAANLKLAREALGYQFSRAEPNMEAASQ